MKPVLRKSLPHPEYSFVTRQDVGDHIRTDWHYHPDYELVLIKKSRGTWLVGDYVGYFASGDVILIGPNLPHSYRHEPQFLQEDASIPGEVTAVLFLKEMFGTTFMNLPEMGGIRQTLALSERGLKLTGTLKQMAAGILENILDEHPGERLIKLLSILQLISEKREYKLLSSNSFSYTYTSKGQDTARISAVFQYTFDNFQNPVTIEEVAAFVHMNKHSFCRFFKEKTNKTYIQFLIEVRVSRACRLLIEAEMNVAEICYACGYNSISHFNHQFKAIKQISPLDYRRKHLQRLATAI
ncbi:MAG TPA: AraC family transcriptional regulator [Anseongella sp.]